MTKIMDTFTYYDMSQASLNFYHFIWIDFISNLIEANPKINN